MELYKIRRKSDGLFSTGGQNPDFTKQGKVWKKKGDINSHITMITDSYRDIHDKNKYPHPYMGCEVVLYELIETEISVESDMCDMEAKIAGRIAKKDEEKNKWQEYYANAQRVADKKQLEELKRKLGE